MNESELPLEVTMLYKLSEMEMKQQSAEPDTWEKAEALHGQKAVGILSGWGTQNIHTTLFGAGMHEVKLSFHIEGDLESFSCTCPVAEASDGFCEHMIATMLKMLDRQSAEIQDEQSKARGWPFNDPTLAVARPDTPEANEILNEIIHGFEGALDEKKKLPLKLEVILEFDKVAYLYGYSAALSLRIGRDRLYIVRDIKNFLRCVIEEEQEFYTKNFEFDGQRHTFEDKDIKVVDLLLEIYEEERIREASRLLGDKSSHVFDKKHVLLSSSRLLKLIEFMPAGNILISSGRDAHPAQVEWRSPKFHFLIDEVGDQLFIRLDSPYVHKVLDSELRMIYDGECTLYVTGQEDRGALKQVESVFGKHSELMLPGDRITDLANSIFPVLKKVGKVSLSDDLSERLVKRTLERRLYLDYTSKGIEIRVVFAYGDKTFEPLKSDGLQDNKAKEHDPDTVILRDKIAENRFLKSFEDRIYERSKEGFLVSGDHNEYLFLSEHAPRLMEQATVYATDLYRDKRVIGDAKIHQSVRVADTEDYLEYTFSIDGIDDSELKKVLKAYRQKKNYYKLKEGRFISLKNDGFDMMDELMGTFDIKSSDLGSPVRLPSSTAYYVEYHLDRAGDAHVARSDSFKRLVSKLRYPESVDIAPPESLKGVLREYQTTGYQWLKTLADCRMGGILADDMGLGKTLQVLTFMLSLKEEEGEGVSLIVAPTSLVYNWASEIEKFTPQLSYQIIHGSKETRVDSLSSKESVDILITSYATLRRDVELYGQMNFRTVILDEAQHIKNASSKAAKTVKALSAKYRFALTGTPMENHLGEFWSIFDFVLPGHLGSRYSFSSTYEKPIVKDEDETKREALRAMIKPFLLRRLKADVLPELPDKIESQILVEMTDEQKKVYAATVARIRSEIDSQIKNYGVAKSQLQILAALTRLRQICSHPAVFLEGYDGSSGKFEALRELLEELKSGGHRTLIFSQFTSVLGLVRAEMDDMNLSYKYLDGSTPAKERGHLVDAFNEGEGDVFLISLKAGGSGLNLTGADTVIHFDPWWNPAVEDQASDRAYRIGQTRNVHVMRLVTRGSIEEKIVKLQEKKRELIDRIIKPGETLLTSLDESEIKAIFDLN